MFTVLKDAVKEMLTLEREDLRPVRLMVVGCSTSEIAGGNIGKAWKEASEAFGFRLTQCCPPEYRMPDTEWEKDLGDTVASAVALDSREDRTILHAANTLTRRKEGPATVFCLNGQTGEEYWHRDFRTEKQDGTQEGFRGFSASPVIGREALDSYIYYTVNGLSPDGRKELGLTDTEDSALIAMDKETGKTVWTYGISGLCASSPVAVYSRDGAGRIIQCLPEGKIVLLDGKRGTVLDELQAGGSIGMSPAVYNNMMVIAATGEDGTHICGIELYQEPEEDQGEDRP